MNKPHIHKRIILFKVYTLITKIPASAQNILEATLLGLPSCLKHPFKSSTAANLVF